VQMIHIRITERLRFFPITLTKDFDQAVDKMIQDKGWT